MISGLPILCSDTAIGALPHLQSWPVHRKICSTTSTATSKLSRKPSSLMACCVRKPTTEIQPLPGFQSLETLEMRNIKRSASVTPFRMDIGYILLALQDVKIPSMGSLLPCLSSVLGYFIIATSTVTKLPQVPVPSVRN